MGETTYLGEMSRVRGRVTTFRVRVTRVRVRVRVTRVRVRVRFQLSYLTYLH